MNYNTDYKHTGEISTDQLKSLGVEYSIIGHYERVRDFNENAVIINNKLIEKNDMCIICQECFEEEQTIMILQCDHFFHRDCLIMWFQYQNKCPLCKKIVH